MQLISGWTKVIDDLLFINIDIYANGYWNPTYRCVHIPSLVISTQLPDGSLSLTENAFNELLPKCIMESHATRPNSSAHTNIYSIPACPPTLPRYCFIIKRSMGQVPGLEWEILEVEIDLSIPGPIKIFSKVSQQYTRQVPTYLPHDNDIDLLLYLQLGRRFQASTSLSIQFLRVGKPGEVRVARLGGIHMLQLSALGVDRDAGYIIIRRADDWPWHRGGTFIWWIDERKLGNMVYSRTKELISSWSRRLLWRVW